MIYVFTLAFMAMDIVTGMAKSFANESFKSTKMREGGWHKFGLIMAIVAGYLVDAAQQYLLPYIGVDFSVPIAGAVCSYIILMELCSTLENICVLNPELMPEKLFRIFGVSAIKDDPMTALKVTEVTTGERE